MRDMVDEMPESAPAAVCSWCSAPLTSPDLDRCPACGAILTGELAEPMPGITAVDPRALSRGTPATVRPRNRLLSWINGDYPEESQTASEAKAIEPPDPAVKREMLRLELEGEVANLKAQADALVAEAAAEGRVVELPEMSALSEEGVAAAEAALRGDEEPAAAVAEPAVSAAPSPAPADDEAAPPEGGQSV
jgi:hypothetical protein